MNEKMVADGLERTFWPKGTTEFSVIADEISATFDLARPNNWGFISNKQYNSIYDDEIYTAILKVRPGYVNYLDTEPTVVCRKFFARNRWVYDKHYVWTKDSICPLPRPAGANCIAIGTMQNIYGQPGDQDFSNYQCLYFTCPDHDSVEQWAGESLPEGIVSTNYAATFLNGERVRMKTYCYDTEDDPLEPWEVFWLSWANSKGLEH